MDSLTPLAQALSESAVRFVVIGVGGANYYLPAGAAEFVTADRDLYLPLDPGNLQKCWETCEALGLEIWSGQEPLDRPRDRWLADRVVEQRVMTRVATPSLVVDFTLVMKGLDFETVWAERRHFEVESVRIPVARLLHIVQSKHAADRAKDRLFLATHQEKLRDLLHREADGER